MWIVNLSFTPNDSTENILKGRYMQLEALEPLFKFFYTFVSKHFSSSRLKYPGKIADK